MRRPPPGFRTWPPRPRPPAGNSRSASGIGIAGCDDDLQRFGRRLGPHLPDGLRGWPGTIRGTWKLAVFHPQRTEEVRQACVQARGLRGPGLEPYGCTAL